jgi:DNA polymerase/3'-5' exonuclease PolX
MKGTVMFPDTFARDIAEKFVNDIKDVCEQIELVGSLRRQKYAVNDIDIIVIPKFIQEDDETLFGEPVQTNLLDRRLSQFCFRGTLSLEANGSKIKRFIKSVDGEDVPIDIYISNKDTWWTLMLIRTGSKNHNIMLAKRAIEMHMQLKADGTGLLSPGGSIIPIGSEEHIFEHLNLPYRIPEYRD